MILPSAPELKQEELRFSGIEKAGLGENLKHAARLEIGLEIQIRQKEKGLRNLRNPFMSLERETGFEPVTLSLEG